MWRLVRDGGGLDLNTPYAYLMLGQWFAATSLVAEDTDGALAGFLAGFRPPEQADTLFVWQIGVAPAARGAGLGSALLDRAVAAANACFLEATVTPGNRASDALFQAFARRHGCACGVSELFPADAFPAATPAHQPECLYRIGPLAA